MATYALKGYSRFIFNLMKGLVSDLSANGVTSVKCALLMDTYTPNQDTHDAYADISTYEITDDATLDPDSDYPAGGLDAALLAGGASVSLVGRVTTFDVDNPSQANCTMGCYKLAFYDDTPALAANKKLICYSSLDGNLKASNSGTFQVVVNTSGLFTITVPA
jgi:hypothetical protein